jgi:phage-related baseplate assembly protein
MDSATLKFLETDAKVLLAEIKAEYEAASGRLLYPAQVENLLLHVQAYREALIRNDVQRCAEQNLIAYATGRHLDELGANKDTPRIQPAAAACRVRFALDAPSPAGRTFPAGARLTTDDGAVAFVTTGPCYVLPGATASTEAAAVCTVEFQSTPNGGPQYSTNGLQPGAVCKLDPPQEGASGANVTATEGGCGLETDDAYRERLKLTGARFGGGSAAAYRLQALSASALVADALAARAGGGDGMERGDIIIYILPRDADLRPGGEAPRELLDIVEAHCNDDAVRIIADRVFARYAEEARYSIDADVTVLEGADADTVMDSVAWLAHEYARSHAARLGADVTPSQILLALGAAREGVYSIDLNEPAAAVVVAENQWARATSIDIRFKGFAHE